MPSCGPNEHRPRSNVDQRGNLSLVCTRCKTSVSERQLQIVIQFMQDMRKREEREQQVQPRRFSTEKDMRRKEEREQQVQPRRFSTEMS
jgi:hypothetical protein